ncbi:MAG: PadR family transcriptional regulator [Gemmatimonadota bacterium]
MAVTPLTYHILMALADADRHGYGIIKEIGLRLGQDEEPSTGALYVALQRMDGEGLITDTDPPAGEAGEADPRRRYYRLTPAGREAARAESSRLAALLAAARAKDLISATGER